MDYILLKLRKPIIDKLIPIKLTQRSFFKNYFYLPVRLIYHPSGMIKRILLPGVNSKTLMKMDQGELIKQDHVFIPPQENLIDFTKDLQDKEEEKLKVLDLIRNSIIFSYQYYHGKWVCTIDGSSGSPVFDEKWQLLGIHRGTLNGISIGTDINKIIENLPPNVKRILQIAS